MFVYNTRAAHLLNICYDVNTRFKVGIHSFQGSDEPEREKII